MKTRGPKTVEGIERIANAQHARWADTLPDRHVAYGRAMSKFWSEADDNASVHALLKYAERCLHAAPSGTERARWKRIADALRAGRRVGRKIRPANVRTR